MFEIEFYRTEKGVSEVDDFMIKLSKKAEKSKDARINRDKILQYMKVLSIKGSTVGEPVMKHIEDDIWELRPLDNRFFYFYWKDSKYVILHQFRKKSNKTPKREIEKAKSNLKDWLERND